jgi:hypothetical protein
MSLLGAHSYKKFNECSLATKTALKPGNRPGHSRGEGEGNIREKSRENGDMKLITQQPQNFTLTYVRSSLSMTDSQ